MRLNKFDEIQLEGVHPTNPITGYIIADYLQTFIVTRDVEGETIPSSALHPFIAQDMPIQAICRINGVPIHAEVS